MNSKVALKYRGIEVEAMKAIALAHQNRSLQEFEQALATYREGKSKKDLAMLLSWVFQHPSRKYKHSNIATSK